MSQIETKFRTLALRLAGTLGVLALLSVLTPLALNATLATDAVAPANGYCRVECADGAWCEVRGPQPCSCTCPADGGAVCKCQGITIIVDPVQVGDNEVSTSDAP